MKTRLPGVGEIERRRTIDRRRDWYESCAMIHGPEEKKKTRKSACDCSKAQPFIIYKPASFEEPVSGDSEEKQSSVTFPVLITEA